MLRLSHSSRRRTVEVAAGGKVSGHYVSVRVEGGASATNNGVISGGYFSGADLDTNANATYPGYPDHYVEAQTVLVLGAGSRFDNNGILNVAGRTFVDTGTDYGIYVLSGAQATNAGVINVGVNNNAKGGAITGAMVGSGASFTNEADGQIYIGRSAQYDVSDLASTGVDTQNNILQFGVQLLNGQAVNNGVITIGSQTQNAAGLYTRGTTGGAASELINAGVIDVNGAAPGAPLQNSGILAINSGSALVRNDGEINLAGVNGIGVKALSTDSVAANVILGSDSVINISGSTDAASGLRNYGVWVEGAGSATATADVDGAIVLNGVGAIGVHARGMADVSVAASAVPSFVSGSDQIGFFIYGPDCSPSAPVRQIE